MKIVVKQSQKPLYEISLINDDLLNGGELFIGREGDCHIQLDSFQVSRYHASILIVNNKVTLRLLSDHGGLKVNGNSVSEKEIFENDKIEIGEYEVVVTQLPHIILEEESPVEIYEENTVIINEGEEELADPEQDLNHNLEVAEEDDLLDASIEESTEDPIEQRVEEDDFLQEDLDVDDSLDSSELDDLEGNSSFDSESEIDNSKEENSELSSGEDNMFESEKTENFEHDEFSETSDEFSDSSEFDGGGFEDDGFSGADEDSGEATKVMQSFANYSLKLFGEYKPFDRYKIIDNEIYVGRDPEKCQIVLDDPEVSKIHCVIKKTLVNCTLEDLDSANGIIFNGERINKTIITNGDEFIIGDTTFSVEISSDLIESEKGMLMPVEEGQHIEIEEVVEEEVDYDGFTEGGDFSTEATVVEEKSFIKKIMKDPKKRMIAMVLGALLIFLFLSDDETTSTETPSQIEAQAKKKKNLQKKEALKNKFSPQKLEEIEQNYALAFAKYEKNELYEAKEYLDIVMSNDPNYKDSQSLTKVIQEGLDGLVKLKAQEQEEKERRARQIKIVGLLEKAKEAVANRNEKSATNYFNLIFDLDPENIDVPPLKLEIEAYVEEEKRKKHDASLLKATRQVKVDKLAPGKTLYLKRNWYKAVDRLEKFIKISDMDEDLIKEATTMLKESQKNLLMIVNPLLSKARSFREGEDLKQSYETFGEVLKYDPSNEEALNARDGIFITLRNRSKRVYRDALVAESLSLFAKAKEKFQEVQQISPINSEYYSKATEKLKNYLE